MPLVIKRYEAGESSVEIGRDLGINAATICDFLERKGVERRSLRKSHLRYQCDERYFQQIDTPEKAYWLGFLGADGAVCPPRWRLMLGHQDRDHLHRLAAALSTDYPVTDYEARGFQYSQLGIWCPQMTEDLTSHGVTPRKSLTLCWPSLAPALYPHYLRGFTDGDGGFFLGWDPKYGYPIVTWGITSNVGFLAGCRDYLMAACDLPSTKFNVSPKNERIAALRYGGRRQVARVFDLLYADATVWLPRKRERVAPYIHAMPSQVKRVV